MNYNIKLEIKNNQLRFKWLLRKLFFHKTKLMHFQTDDAELFLPGALFRWTVKVFTPRFSLPHPSRNPWYTFWVWFDQVRTIQKVRLFHQTKIYQLFFLKRWVLKKTFQFCWEENNVVDLLNKYNSYYILMISKQRFVFSIHLYC